MLEVFSLADTRHAKANKFNRIAAGVLVVIVSLFCFLSLVGALGGVGEMVYSFLVGFFGLAAYAYALMALVIGIAVTFNVSPKMKISRAIILFALLFVGILALNVYTSSAHILGANYKTYLLNCYYGLNTAGGMLFAIPSFPLMKAVTSVGALVIVCVLFFILAFFAIYPSIKRNVTYTVASSRERDGLSGVRREREAVAYATPQDTRKAPKAKRIKHNGHKIDTLDMPALTNFGVQTEDGPQLFAVSVDGSIPYKGGKKMRGADGYKPLGSFNPLYPNKQGGYEDEVRVKPQYTEESFSPRAVAKDILFGNGPSRDNLSRFGSANDPRNALSNVSPTYSAVRRTELRSKLGIDATTNEAIKEDFMARYRAYQPESEPQVAVAESVVDEIKEEKKLDNTNIDFKRDFNQIKQEQIKMFGERYAKPEFEADTHTTQQDDVCLEAETVKREVVKPTKTHGDEIAHTIERAKDSVQPQVNIGMLGALNRAMYGEEPHQEKVELDMSATAYDEPKPQTSKVLEVLNAREKSSISAPVEEVKYVEPIKPQQAQKAQPTQPIKTQQPTQTVQAPQQSVEPKRELPIVQQKPAKSVADVERSGYTPVQGEKKIPRAFAQTALDSQVASGVVANDSKVQRPQKSVEELKKIKEVKSALKETPEVGEYERAALMREAKVRAAEGRGIESSLRKMEKIDVKKERVTQVSMEQAIQQATPKRPYVAPPISLLEPPAPEVDQNEDYEQKKTQIINTLAFFSITGEVIDIMVGPTFTMYKLRVEMPRGKTINYISSLESDIAMKMEVSSVRIIAPIPGENAVGIEVPNKHRRNVNLSEILQSPEFNKQQSPATFALGKNLYGTSRVVEVRKLPHVLIAGATGAGKSCCINSIIVSLLYKASPDDVRLILIDPKRIEMSVYKGIPHLLMDEIICDTDKAIRSLNWAIQEMERRIKYLADVGYRDIDDYNADCAKHKYDKMPRIIIIVDEFADLMSTGKKAVEDTVNRIARLARAVGIHLVLATQRPSVDVISGTIKNNFPSRVAFKVTSSFDSKTILDTVGADKLLGYGDLLYMTPGSSDLERMQGAFISNEDVKKVVDFVKEKNDAFFDNTIKDAIFKEKEEASQQSKDGGAKGSDKDKTPPEFYEALRLGIELKEQDAPISISFMQRRLGLGWPKAAKIYDMMDLRGYLTPDEHDPKKKKVNISYEELEELQSAENEDTEE